MHKKRRSAVHLELNLCVNFAIKFSMSPKIAVSHQNVGGAENIFPTGVWVLKADWENFAVQGALALTKTFLRLS